MNSKVTLHYLRVIFKSLIEFIPVFIFVIIFKCTENFYLSTFLLIISTVLFTYYTFYREKRIPYLSLFICLETTIFGALTISLKDPVYVQMRDTFYDLVLGSLILITGFLRVPIIKKFFGHMFDLELDNWVRLSYAWGIFLLSFAMFNEYFRRNHTEEVWINYKIFALVITFAFGLFLLWKFRKSVKAFDLL